MGNLPKKSIEQSHRERHVLGVRAMRFGNPGTNLVAEELVARASDRGLVEARMADLCASCGGMPIATFKRRLADLKAMGLLTWDYDGQRMLTVFELHGRLRRAEGAVCGPAGGTGASCSPRIRATSHSNPSIRAAA